MINLDLQKTFDKVPHKRLFSKLRIHEIGAHLCAWIGDWLSDHQQRVVLNFFNLFLFISLTIGVSRLIETQMDLPRLLFGVSFQIFYSDVSNV